MFIRVNVFVSNINFVKVKARKNESATHEASISFETF